MVEKQIELLKKQIDKLEEKEFDLDGWKSSTKVLLGRIFGDNNQGIKAIDNIKFNSGGWAIGDASHFGTIWIPAKNREKIFLKLV